MIRSVRGLALLASLAGIYFLAGKLGLSLAFVNVSATSVWPPSGIALAALLAFGYGVWPGVLIGAFLVNLATAGTVATSLAIAVGNTLEGVLGAYLVNRCAGGHNAFHRSENVFRFAILAGALATMVSATVGVTTLQLGGLARWSNYGAIWLTWWLGDAGGVIVLAPVLLLWSRRQLLRWTPVRLSEAAALLACLLLVTEVIFGRLSPFANQNHPIIFLCLPVVTWAAFRFGPRETSTTVLAISGIATWATLQGLGPFARYAPETSLLLLQAFMGVTAVTTLVLSAAVSERREAQAALRVSHDQLERRVEQRTADLARTIEALNAEVLKRERMGQELRQNELRLRTLVESIDDVAFEFDEQGTTLNIWTRNESLLPRPKKELIGHPAGDFLGQESVRSFLEAFVRVLQTGTGETIEYSLDLEGGRRWFLGRISRVFSANGSSGSICLLLRDISVRKQAEESLRNLSRRLLQLQDEERRRMARELHDSTAQVLAALDMQLSVVGGQAARLDPRGQAALQESFVLAGRATREIRTLSYLLHPPLLDEVGLHSALEWYVEGFSKRSQIRVELQIRDELPRLPHEVEMAVFRIVQESLANILRHSGSPTAQVHLQCRPGEVVLELRDQGRGMDLQVPGNINSHVPIGVGIAGMKERVQQLGGRLLLESSPRGTTVRAVIPLA